MPNIQKFAVGLAAAFLTSVCLFAQQQHLSWGVIGGIPLTQDFNSTSQDTVFPPPLSFTFHQDYLPALHGFPIGGLAVEWHFNSRVSIEADGIFRELHYKIDSGGVPITVVTWQIPVLAKYRFDAHTLVHTSFRPFLEAGPSYRTTGNLNQADPSHLGISAGAGLEIPLNGFSLSPTLRYTRWQQDGALAFLDTRPDQLEFLVGFTHSAAFGYRSSFPLSVGGFVGTNLLADYGTTAFSDSGILFPGNIIITNQTLNTSGPHSVLFGGQVELKLPFHLAIEGDVIKRNAHSQYRSTETENGVASTYTGNYSFNMWQFPVLAKWTPVKMPLLSRDWRPVIEAGPSFRLPVGITRFGFTTGLGLEHPLWKFTIEPTLRYTRWQSDPYNPVKPDELDVILGLRF